MAETRPGELGAAPSIFDVETMRRVRAVLTAEADDFGKFVTLAGLDPERDFRWADLSDMDMRGADLRAFDFSFSRFCRVDVTGADIRGTRFGGADLTGTDLAKAVGYRPGTAIVDLDSKADRLEQRLPDLTIFRDRLASGTFGAEMVVIPAGEFMMGDNHSSVGFGRLDSMRLGDEDSVASTPPHEVAVGRFALGRYPVTFEEYDRYCAAEGIERPGDNGWGRGRLPVTKVSWEDAANYCVWLSAKTGNAYRLPSEAEWEYACRAGTVTEYSWGDVFDAKWANAAENVGETTPVGDYPSNPWSLHDVHGNAWEWCADCWHDSYDGAPSDGSAWVVPLIHTDDIRRRILRGGSWSNSARKVRAASRIGLGQGDRFHNVGFRCARDLE